MKNKEEQFTRIPHSLMLNEHLTDQDKLTLGVILSFIKNGKECYIGNDKLGKMLGITKNAASSRVLRLEKIGCVALRYTYKEGTKLVDKRYITLLSLTPKVSSTKRDISSDRREGIVHETKGYSPTDEGVSSKLGGIIQPYYTSVLDNVVDKSLDKVLNKENSVELSNFDKEQLLITLDEIKAPENVLGFVKILITDGPGFLTNKNKELILQHKTYFNKGNLLPKVIQQIV